MVTFYSKTTMSSQNDDPTPSSIDDIYIPTDSEGIPLMWNGNPATIMGLLHEVDRHCKRKAILAAFIQHGAAVLSSGRIAVPDVKSIYFIDGTITDEPRTIANMLHRGN